MSQEPEMWSPDHELRLLEELADAEDHSFDLEMDLAIRVTSAEPEHPWRAYWHRPPSRFRSKARGHSGVARRR